MIVTNYRARVVGILFLSVFLGILTFGADVTHDSFFDTPASLRKDVGAAPATRRKIFLFFFIF